MAATSNTTSTVENVSDGNSQGSTFGQSTTDKISFHGATAVAQQTVTAVATGATIASVVTTMQQLQAALETVGLIADS